LETISIIDDKDFLNSVVNSLKKIYNLSNTFARFKQTIMATSAIHIPKSTIDVCNQVKVVLPEIDCAMGYITNFVNPDPSFSSNYELSTDEKKTINNAISAINNWKILSDQGAKIAMENNEDIKNVKTISASLKLKSNTLKSLTFSIKDKLASYKVLDKPILSRENSN
jgi:lipopolysaccharide biosynthesis regulator YciM